MRVWLKKLKINIALIIKILICCIQKELNSPCLIKIPSSHTQPASGTTFLQTGFHQNKEELEPSCYRLILAMSRQMYFHLLKFIFIKT